ncbi:EAL domain-containing protein [Zobellella maritima]|uniref:EAL domain-containing protein n=1 Tax=Zobellella maritima TaxID=2059725 RepID=UPI000E308FBF|nr:EAL domain-containing protein [Zobellella maritima]
MRESRTFNQILILAALISVLTGLLLPWWGGYRLLAHHEQETAANLTAWLSSAEQDRVSSLPGIAQFSYEQPLPPQSSAWWFGSAAETKQLIVGETPFFYQLDTHFATRYWLSLSLPLMVISLMLFIGLYVRWSKEHQRHEQHLHDLIVNTDPELATGDTPLEQSIIQWHQAYQNQIETLQQQLSEAHQQSHQDSLTNLGNRYAFRRDLTQLLNDENKLAVSTLLMIRATALNEINNRLDHQAGDQYLQDITRIVRKAIQPMLGAKAYRTTGTDIAVLIKGQCDPLAQSLGTQLHQDFNHYQHLHGLDCTAYMGFTQLLPGQSPEQVLVRVDSALAHAQVNEPNSWQVVHKNEDDKDLGETQWRQRLEAILEEERIHLMVQPVQFKRADQPGYNEILSRFPNETDGWYPSSTVFAMLQRLDLSMHFERKIIETAIHRIATKNLSTQRWAINLTPASLQHPSFVIWLERILLRDVNVTSSLVFELDEHILEYQLVAGKRLIEMLRRCGARSAISKFGHGYGSFRQIKELKPDYIKLDAQLVKHLQDDSANQQFVRMIVDLAQRLGCQVIAEGVETPEQKRTLDTMYIDGIQGYLIARPTDLDGFSRRAVSSA